jgi:hypothetical protein
LVLFVSVSAGVGAAHRQQLQTWVANLASRPCR